MWFFLILSSHRHPTLTSPWRNIETSMHKKDSNKWSVRGYMHAVYCKAANNYAGALQSHINMYNDQERSLDATRFIKKQSLILFLPPTNDPNTQMQTHKCRAQVKPWFVGFNPTVRGIPTTSRIWIKPSSWHILSPRSFPRLQARLPRWFITTLKGTI